MWHEVEQEIRNAVGNDFKIVNKTPLAGGDIHQAYLVESEQTQFFVKFNDKRFLEAFEAEFLALNTIKQTQTIQTPATIASGNSIKHAFLILEYLELNDADNEHWDKFGEHLAGMHQTLNQAMYGWQEDNFIGRSAQCNQWHKKWSHFFAEARIGNLLEVCQEAGKPLVEDIANFTDIIKQHLANHMPTPALVHGDLWRGNHDFCQGTPVIYDPASYYGDPIVDIAMTELFGRLPDEFYQAYFSINAKPENYTELKSIYNLYHIINHFILFGGQYEQQAKAQIKQLLAY